MYEDRIQWINQKGKKILYVDYTNLSANEVEQMKDKLINTMTSEPLNSVLGIIDGTNLHFSMKVMSIFSEQSSKIDPHYKACAILGVAGLTRVMYEGVAKFAKVNMKTFNKKEDAFDWLTKL